MTEQEKEKRFIRPHKGGRSVRFCGVHFTPEEAEKMRLAHSIGHSVADCAVAGANVFLKKNKKETSNDPLPVLPPRS